MFSGAIALACAAGCNALTGADAFVLDDGEDALFSGASGGAPANGEERQLESASSGSVGDSSPASSSGGAPEAGTDAPALPAGAIIDETFPDDGACTGLAVTNGASKAYDANGRSSGACKVCAVSAGAMFVELSGTATRAGQATFDAYARRVPGASTPTSASIQLRAAGGSIASSANLAEDAWTRLGGGSITVQDGTAVLLRIGLSNAAAGECLLIDDARVAVP